MDLAFKVLAHALSGMFVVGLVGCLLVVPATAYKLFSVLFEQDREEDI